MLWVKIKADLERKIRKSKCAACVELVAAIEGERAKLAAKEEEAREGGRVTWGWILSEFRKSLGDDLALPPTPSAAWISTQVQRVRRLGLDESQIQAIAVGARILSKNRELRNPPWNLEVLLIRAVDCITAAERDGLERGDSGVPGYRGHSEALGRRFERGTDYFPVVRTGRPDEMAIGQGTGTPGGGPEGVGGPSGMGRGVPLK